jgi:Fic family protein
VKDKFNLTRHENTFLAKKLLIDSVYNSIKLEGLNMTFSQIKTILEGVSISNVPVDNVQTVLNLRNAWRYLLNNIDAPFSLSFSEKINGFVAYNESLEWGVLRNGDVGIGGVNYRPSIPKREETENQIAKIMNIENATERALKLMLYCMRSQLFWDGNKRTSIICANKIMIEKGKGIITIPEEVLEEFNTRLSKFYESNDYNVIVDFLYERCIIGIIKSE